MGPVKLNLKQSEVDQSLRSLVQKTLVPGVFPYVYERVGAYSAFAETQGQHFAVYGMTDEQGEVIGATQITFDEVYWNGQPTQISYSGDTRISPKARGQKLADRLLQAACSVKLPVLGAVMGSNTLVLEKKLNDWKKVGVDFKVVGELKALLYRAIHLPPLDAFTLRSATSADLSAMYELWKKEQIEKNLGRFFSSLEAFTQCYEKTAGISLEQTILIEGRESEELLGYLSIWDQSSIRKMRMQKLSRLMRGFCSILRPWIKLPKAGEELKIAYAFQMAIDSTRPSKAFILEALIREARSRSEKSGFVFFTLGMDARDALYPVAKKSSLTANSVKIIAANATPDGRLFHLEVGLG